MVNNLTEGKPLKLLFFFAMPMVVGNLFQQLYNMVDSMVVGGVLWGRMLWQPLAHPFPWFFVRCHCCGAVHGLYRGYFPVLRGR